MRMRIAIFVSCAFFLLTGITHGGQIEVSGDFSVWTTGKYSYESSSSTAGWLSPRCSCDIDQNTNDCANPFYSDTDQGSFCYDNFVLGLQISRQYVRSDASPTLDVTKDKVININDADLYFKNSDDGIILKAPNGICWHVWVDNGGALRTRNTTCP